MSEQRPVGRAEGRSSTLEPTPLTLVDRGGVARRDLVCDGDRAVPRVPRHRHFRAHPKGFSSNGHQESVMQGHGLARTNTGKSAQARATLYTLAFDDGGNLLVRVERPYLDGDLRVPQRRSADILEVHVEAVEQRAEATAPAVSEGGPYDGLLGQSQSQERLQQAALEEAMVAGCGSKRETAFSPRKRARPRLQIIEQTAQAPRA
jgi:hypothetical protein